MVTQPKTMKALQITGKESYAIAEVPIPVPQDHEILVQIDIVATCPRWDMNMYGGRDMFDYSRSPQYPLAPGFPGHEAAGVVRAVGKGVTGYQVGDRVAALEHIEGNGAYAEYICYREHEVLKLPDHISFKQAASFELLKCVMIGLSQFGDLRGKSVLVSGLGPAGMLAIQAAAIWGASRVVGIDLNQARIDEVNRLGLGTAMHADQVAPDTFDLGYDCVGASASVQYLLDNVRSHVVIFGVLKGSVQFDERLWLRGTKLEAYRYRSFGERDRELLLDAVGNKGLNCSCLLTHHIPFTRYEDAVKLLQTQQAVKVYFHPGSDLGQEDEA
ncbi:zinc-dependent alcohol dehydrogenase [Cohnella hashimotonis]|uniref:Alcohol dehydrogenase catalytic domain-containing protein n=1 Tax=Cohnella hashimotonis TaxID=2826895 RepID=A0ABT6TRS3_9BACL|nr:alcohol dehydrogenase catalytic domain-containing protein [Cohnella hashimotonis]MDI4649231.1 alcohol dehydrogenase catalytic domain-containing protein [Cohnella hashimotonis]